MDKPLILVVEDDRAVRSLVTTTLDTHDYKYITAQMANRHCWKLFLVVLILFY